MAELKSREHRDDLYDTKYTTVVHEAEDGSGIAVRENFLSTDILEFNKQGIVTDTVSVFGDEMDLFQDAFQDTDCYQENIGGDD